MANKRSFLLQIIGSSIASNMCLGVINPCYAWEKSGPWETGKTDADNIDVPNHGRTNYTDKTTDKDRHNYGRSATPQTVDNDPDDVVGNSRRLIDSYCKSTGRSDSDAIDRQGQGRTGLTDNDGADTALYGRTMRTDNDAEDCYNYGRGT